MSDKDYCAALARKWRSFSRTGAQGPAPQAIAQCDAGNYDAGITVLEQVLTDDRSCCRRAICSPIRHE